MRWLCLKSEKEEFDRLHSSIWELDNLEEELGGQWKG